MSSNITHADLVNMRTNFVGACMGSMLYGQIPARPFEFYQSDPLIAQA
jgi:hypothetical protein